MRWLIALLACINVAQAQVIQHQISDDGFARVPLQFPFPYYGRVFTESYMFSNGVVGFLNPSNSWCCTGFDLRVNNGTPFNFAIMPLQTDLLNYSGRFLTEGTNQYQRYKWENISEFGMPENLNTFGLEIRPSGSISINYEQINISPGRPITMGMTGDTDQGQYTQFYHGMGFIEGPGRSYNYNADPCYTNPLYSPSCRGYTEAYLTQQCSISSLYDSTCPGYNEAYALANIVTPTAITISAPILQVSMTGNVSVETPVISDPIVNEVVTRPAPTASNPVFNSRNPEPSSQPSSQPEKKDPKPEVKVATKPQVKSPDGASIEMPNLTPTVAKIEQVQLIDLLSTQIVNRPLSTNARAYYLMSIGGQLSHERMVDEQYRR